MQLLRFTSDTLPPYLFLVSLFFNFMKQNIFLGGEIIVIIVSKVKENDYKTPCRKESYRYWSFLPVLLLFLFDICSLEVVSVSILDVLVAVGSVLTTNTTDFCLLSRRTDAVSPDLTRSLDVR